MDSAETAVEAVRRRLTPRSVALYLCTPSNPTGRLLSRSWLEALAEWARRENLWLLADEVYRGAEMDGPRGATFWGRYERVICTGGLSKAYGLPGLRVGWAVAPAVAMVSARRRRQTRTMKAPPLQSTLVRCPVKIGRAHV